MWMDAAHQMANKTFPLTSLYKGPFSYSTFTFFKQLHAISTTFPATISSGLGFQPLHPSLLLSFVFPVLQILLNYTSCMSTILELDKDQKFRCIEYSPSSWLIIGKIVLFTSTYCYSSLSNLVSLAALPKFSFPPPQKKSNLFLNSWILCNLRLCVVGGWMITFETWHLWLCHLKKDDWEHWWLRIVLLPHQSLLVSPPSLSILAWQHNL